MAFDRHTGGAETTIWMALQVATCWEAGHIVVASRTACDDKLQWAVLVFGRAEK